MGWASYLEDIRDRLDQDLANVEEFLHPVKPQRARVQRCAHDDVLARISVFLKTGYQVRSELDKALDLATNPKMDLAKRVLDLERTTANQQGLIRRLQHDIEQKARRVAMLESQIAKARQERDQWKREANALRVEFRH